MADTSNNDFFVRFDSNASVWARGLDAQLAPARQAVGTLSKLMKDLETTAANRATAASRHLTRLSREAVAIQAQLDAIDNRAGQVGGGGGGGNLIQAGSSTVDLDAMVRSIGSLDATLDGFMTKLGRTVDLIGRAGEEFMAAKESYTRSEAQKTSPTSQTNTGYRFPQGTITGQVDQATGQVIRAWSKKLNDWLPEGVNVSGRRTKDLPGAVPEAVYREQKQAARDTTRALEQSAQLVRAEMAAGAQQTAPVVRLDNIPQATIDEASFTRVVTAIERNVTATEGVEQAVDRLTAMVARGGLGGGGDVDVPELDEGVAERVRLTKAQNQELYRAFRDQLEVVRQAGGEDAYRQVWGQLVEKQHAALAGGGSIITEEMRQQVADEDANKPKLGQKAMERLAKNLNDLETEARDLSEEIETLARRMQQGEQISDEFARKMNQLADVERRRDSARTAFEQEETRAETRERNRRAALREAQRLAGTEISVEERNARQLQRAQLELAANPERLQEMIGRGAGQLGKRELVDIADTLTRQGYPTPLGPVKGDTGLPRASVKDITDAIVRSGQQYVAARRVTAEDLSLRRTAPTSQIDAQVANMMGPALRQFNERFGTQIQEAFEIIGRNIRSGGEDPRRLIDASSVPGSEARQAGRTKGRLRIGSEIGEEGREALIQAGEDLDEFMRQRAIAARTDVAALMRQDPLSFRPNPEELFGGIEGRGEEAQASRRNVAAMLQATDEIDNFGRGLHDLDAEVQRNQAVARDAMGRLVDYMMSGEAPTKEQKQQANRDQRVLDQMERRNADLNAEIGKRMAAAQEFIGGDASFLRSPEFIESIRQRDLIRTGGQTPDPATEGRVFSAEQVRNLVSMRRTEEREAGTQQYQNRVALMQAVSEYFGRSRIFGTEQGNTRDYFTSALPGVRAGGGANRFRLEYRDPDQFSTPEDRARASRALRQMTSGMAGYSSRLYALIDATADGDRSEDELTAMRQRVIAALARLLSGYQAAFREAPVPDARSFLPPELFGLEADQLVAREDIKGEERRQTRAAIEQEKRDKLEADARAAYEDPGREAALNKQNAAALKERTKEVARRLEEAEAEIALYEKEVTAARRALTQELRPKEREDARDLQRQMDELRTREGIMQTKADVRGQPDLYKDELAENRARQQEVQRQLDVLYNETPALRERKEALDAAERRLLEARYITPEAGTTPRTVAGRTIEGPDPARGQEQIDRVKALKQERDDLQKQRRFLTGNVTKKDLEEAEAALAKLTERLVQQQKQRATITERLSTAEARLAQIDEKTAARRASSGEDELWQMIDEQLAGQRRAMKRFEDEALDAERAGDYDSQDDLLDRAREARAEISRLETMRAQLNVPSPDIEGRGQATTHTLGETPSTVTEAIGEHEELLNTRRALLAEVKHYQEVLRDNSNALNAQEAEIEEARRALARLTQTWRERDSKRGDKAEDPANVAGGAPPPGVPPTATGGEFEESGGDNILGRILRAIIDVNRTLQGPLKVTGSLTGEGGTVGAAGRGTRPIRSTEQGRADFEASIGQTLPAIGQMLGAGENVQAAAEMVARGVASETRVLDLFRDKLNQTAVQAREFREQVAAATGDIRLRAIADAAAERRAQQEAGQFETLGGETMTREEARAEMDTDLAKRSRKVRELEQEARALRETASQTERLRVIMTRLTPETRKEIAELERMARAADNSADSQARLAAQMGKVYGMVGQDIGPAREGGGAVAAREATKQIYAGAGIKSTAAELDEMARYAKAQGFRTIDSAAAQGVIPGGMFGQQSLFTQAMFGNHGFWSRMMASTGTFVVRNFAAGFVFGMTAALQDVIAQAIETERTFVRVSHALEATGRSSEGLRGDLAGIAQEYGTNLNDVYTVAAGLTGLFDTTQEIAGATEIVSQLTMISSGALNAQEAMGALASIQGAFATELGTGVDGLEKVADVLTSVQNNVGTNVEVTAEAVGRMSGLAAQLGLSYEEVAVYGAQIAKLTNQTGAAAGEQFSRILSVVQSGRGRSAILDAFQTVTDQETGTTRETDIAAQLQARDYSGVLRTMQEEWDNLSEAQQQNVSVSIAGQRQAAAFAALMNNGQRTLNAIARAENSHGDALERTAELMKTLQGQISILGSELQVLMSNLLRSGILDFLGIFLMVTNRLLNVINTVFGTLNDLAESNPVLNFAKEATFAILGFIAVLTLLRKSWAGLKATLDSMPGIQAARATPGIPRTSETLQQWREGAAARGGQLLYGVTGGDQQGRNVGAPISRAVGRAVDNVVIRPLNAVGQAAERFGSTLNQRAAQMRSDRGWALGGDANARRVSQFGQDFTTIGGALQGPGRWRSGEFSVTEALRQRAQSLSFAAQGAQVAANQDPTNRALQRQALTLGSMSRAADLGARATGRVASGFQRLASSGVGADAAMLALGTAITAVITSAMRDAEAASAVADLMDARRKKGQGGEQTPDAYLGPAQEAYEEFTKAYTEQGSNFQAGLELLGQGIADTLSGVAGMVTGGRLGDLENIDNLFTGETIEEMTGTKDGKVAGLDAAQKAFDDGMKQLNEMAAQPGVTSEELAAKQAEITEEFFKADRKIEDNAALSQQQRLGALAMSEQARMLITEQAEALVAQAEGLAQAGLLESEQLTRLQELGPALGGIQGQGRILSELRSGINALEGEAGITGANPEIDAALARLSSGGLTNVETAKEQAEIISKAAKQAEIKYLNALASGETELIEERRGVFLQLMGQMAAITEQNIQLFIQEAQLISEAAFNLGDYEGGREALQKAIDDINAERPEGAMPLGAQGDLRDPTFRISRQRTLSPADIERNAEIDAQVRPLYEQMWQSQVTEENALLQMRSARGQGEVAAARNNLQQQQNTLNIMRQAKQQYGALGPTTEQMRQQQIAVYEAQQQMAATLASKTVARFALAAAGLWNEVAINMVNEKAAVAALADAIDRFGRGSVEALQARAGLRQARKTRIQSQDAEEQAARETALAAIPQGNQVAIAQQQLRNAMANLRDARKYGQTSVQYQSALQQLYSAQQQVASSQSALRTAQLQLAQAYANARGDAVGAAAIGVSLAQEQYAAALEASGGATTVDTLNAQAAIVAAQDAAQQAQADLAQAQISVLQAQADANGNAVRSAQLQARAARVAMGMASAGTAEWYQAKAQLIAANAAIEDAQLDLIQSRIGVSIALAEAAGNTVRAARLQVRAALAALRAATPGTSEYNQARADVIASRAAVRDAILQDQLDTIDFNLEMGRMTQSAAIAALRDILRTSDLTKEQRRQLLLQIKGMQEELSGSPWNFGDIKLPKPYLMKRYIEQTKRQNQRSVDEAIAAAQGASAQLGGVGGAMSGIGQLYNDNRNVEIVIQGGNEQRIREIIRDVVGRPIRTRTAASRRGRR